MTVTSTESLPSPLDATIQLWPAATYARLLAHPGATSSSARQPKPPAVVAIGPEGGWVPFEVELLEAHGFRPFSLGPRILRVETAVPYVFGLLG